MTANEIVSALKRTTMPTLCVEGTQDRAALRKLEDFIGVNGAIFICEGRNNLFKVFERYNEFSNKKVAFLADKDLYVFHRPPKLYKGIIFTTGYSLENDILSSRQAELLFETEDRMIFKEALEVASKYYWQSCKSYFDSNIQPDWPAVYSIYAKYKDSNIVLKCPDENCKLWKNIKSNPYKYLRGKYLLSCTHIPLNRKQRSTKYSPSQIIDISTKTKKSAELKKLIHTITKSLQ